MERKGSSSTMSKNYYGEKIMKIKSKFGEMVNKQSFLYIDDCIEGTLRLFESNYSEPVNIGSDEQVSINQMIDILEVISEIKKLNRDYQLDKPKGVRGRSSNNDLVKKF